MKNILTKIITISFILIGFSFIGCSENLPEVRNADYSVIFEYDENDSLPNARLSVFVETVSEVRRAEELIVKSDNTEYFWDTTDILILEHDKKSWAGNTNFVLPEPEQIPSGKYTITYVDAAGEETEVALVLSYDKTFYKLKASEVSAYMKKTNNLKKLALYDELDTLIYYGEETSDLSSKEKIQKAFRSAAFMNEIWCRRDNSVICILPKESVK